MFKSFILVLALASVSLGHSSTDQSHHQIVRRQAGASKAAAAAGVGKAGAAAVGVSTATANNPNPQNSLTLSASQAQGGLTLNGQQTPSANQVASATSGNNFINFCLTRSDLPLTNGAQVKTGSCNPTVMGVIAAQKNMPSCKFSNPANGAVVKAFTDFEITMNIKNLITGNFVNAAANYFAAPQNTDASGQVIGHSHVVIEAIDSLSTTTAPDPTTFAFFKGLNAAAVNGVLSATVTGGLPVGTYKMSSINTAANHQPVLVAVAQHGSLDDVVYFTVIAAGIGAAVNGQAAPGGAAAAASSTGAGIAGAGAGTAGAGTASAGAGTAGASAGTAGAGAGTASAGAGTAGAGTASAGASTSVAGATGGAAKGTGKKGKGKGAKKAAAATGASLLVNPNATASGATAPGATAPLLKRCPLVSSPPK